MVCKGCGTSKSNLSIKRDLDLDIIDISYVIDCKCTDIKCGDNCSCSQDCKCVCKNGTKAQCCSTKAQAK
ncbi:hypothetical protein KR222_008667 [Zaprionus bogoriensis]|nr:hypothetical protein KR222_008667 [Zaprionus bogoriensis]